MPSLEHNGLVDLFRNNPDLGAHLLTVAFGIPVPPHSKTTVVEAALGRFDPDTASVYLQIIYETLREPMRKALEIAIMEHVSNKEVTLPPFALKLISIGEERGETRGKREGKQDALLLLARRLGVSLSAEQRARIEACEDMATLDRWLDRVVDAKSADDLFA